MAIVDLGNIGTGRIEGRQPRTPEGPRGRASDGQAKTKSPATAKPSSKPAGAPAKKGAIKTVNPFDELKEFLTGVTKDLERLSKGDVDGVSQKTKDAIARGVIDHMKGRSSLRFTVGDKQFEFHKDPDGSVGGSMTMPIRLP